MKKICVLFLTFFLGGCQSIVSTTGVDYKYENHAYIRSTSNVNEATEKAGFICLSNGDYSFAVKHRVRASYLKRDGEALVFNCYLVSKEQIIIEEKNKKEADMKAAEEAYKNLYTAKERLYESYRKDGKLHTDTYTEPDGTIRSTTIHGNSRCDLVSGVNGATSTCQ